MQHHVEGTTQETSRRRRVWVKTMGTFAAAAVMVGTVVTLTAAPAHAACGGSSVVDAGERTAESSFVSKLNALRSSKGLRTLVVNDGIVGPARQWSATMSAQDWLHHARDTGSGDGVAADQDYVTLVSAVVPNWSRVAENVGVSSIGSWCTSTELESRVQQSVSSLHNAFVASSGHYKNMIGDFNQVGIGVHIDSAKLWVTVRFAMGDIPFTSAQKADAAAYIHSAYRLFIGRNATSSEISKWTSPVLTGGRYKLTKALAVSTEWAGVRIEDLYQQILQRSADSSGKSHWLNTIRSGDRLEDVAAYFYGSREFYLKAGGTKTAFVNALYEGILGRKADASGRDFWLHAMRYGMGRDDVAAEFYASTESRLDRVSSLYWEVLGRGPDSGGLSHWSRELRTKGDVTLAAILGSSWEYWLRSID